ncbi:MAG: NTP transferase domain-containing protein [Candidatus Levybacteria bacterium]|nr:NTP transferase domain-containing protein [Candidatus Levybacteria bacterium]
MKTSLAGIVLAAGKGKRMELGNLNKVTLLLGGKSMVVHGVDLLKKLKISPIIIVVGFAKESVKKLFPEGVIFAQQRKRLGTAHAVKTALPSLAQSTTDVLVIQGDDSAFYREVTLRDLIKLHKENKNSLTFLTIDVSNPQGLGRIIRDKNGQVIKIVEEKDVTQEQRKMKEINPACYVFNLSFLKKYLPKVAKSPISGEYYLVSLVELAIRNKEKMGVVKGGKMMWRGVNTKEELEEAQRLYSQKIKE